MQTRDIIELIGAITGSVVVLGGILGALIYGIRKGSRDEKSDILTSSQQLIDHWKSQAEDYKALNEELRQKMADQKEDYTKQIHDLSTQIATIRGQFEQSEKQKKEYLEILQGSDKTSQEYRAMVLKSIQDFQGSVKRINDRLDGIEGKLNQTLSGGKVK